MNFLLLLLGLALLLIAVVDALWTTLWVDGSAGPMTSRLTTWAWRATLTVFGRRSHHLLSLFGPAVQTVTVLLWVGLLWAGWVFVFAADDRSLLDTRDQTPADWTGRIYFVAYSMFTMGNGDFTPNGGVWQIATALTTGSGILLVTMVISYLLSVLSAVVRKRAFASQVASLGNTSDEIVRTGWNGRDLRALDRPLSSLSTDISVLTEQYLAYPILQYYHAARPSKSPAIGIAVLDEALTLLRYGVPEEYRPNPAVLNGARATVASFLDTLQSAFISPASEAPPAPDLDALRKAGVPTVEVATFEEALARLEDRRRKLLGLVRNDGWHWPER